jgi:2-dehydropantoate 2-reductase
MRVGVVGPGAVGGALAVRLALAGCDVTCVARPATAAVLRAGGLELDDADGVRLRAVPAVVERLEAPVELLLVTTKAYALEDALRRVASPAVTDAVVVTLLNGLEHPAVVRAALGRRVAPGSISRFEAHLVAPGHVVQRSPGACVALASDDVERARLEEVAALLRLAGLEATVADDERAVLWQKGARLAVLAAATAASELTVGELRRPPWRARLGRALEEACAAARREGVEVTPAAQWEIIDAMAPTLTTSTARDVAAGRQSELDAICGAVLRAAGRAGLACPELGALVAQAEARAR